MSAQSILFDALGEHPTEPEIRVQPTAQRAAPTADVGWSLRRRYTLENTGDAAVANHPYAINIGATDALVTGNKALASGNDLRVWINGQEVARSLNTFNSATDCLVWITIPFLAAGASMVVDVVYGNSAAGSPPTLTVGTDLPAFDIAATGASRSTNTFWRYLVERIAANAGKGGWHLDSGTAQPNARFGVPGAWQPVNTLPSDDDRRQEASSTYTDSGTKYQARFEAKRARGGTMPLTEDDGTDGVAIRVPTAIASVRADIRWQNLAVGDTDTTPVGKVMILTRNSEGETWKTLSSNAALQTTEATIATATYTPTAAVKELAFAVWPQDGNIVDQAARSDRYVNAAWYTTLELNLTASVITQTLTTAETAIYELATELRSGGGGDATAVPPYKSIFLGNAKSASGAGTPRLAVELNQQVAVFTAARTVEVWNSGLTAKVEDAPIPAVSAVDGVLVNDGSTVERPSTEWMPLTPQVDPLTNSSADTVVTGWTRGTVTSGVTAGARTRDAAVFDSTPAGFSVEITANTAGAGAIVEEIADDYLPTGDRDNVQVGVAVRTADIDLQVTPSIWWYEQSQVALSGTPKSMQADWTVAGTAAFYRRLFAAAVPEGAVYYRVGVTIKDKVGAQTGIVRWDTVAVNDTEIALRDVAIGAITLSARWRDRYAYA